MANLLSNDLVPHVPWEFWCRWKSWAINGKKGVIKSQMGQSRPGLGLALVSRLGASPPEPTSPLWSPPLCCHVTLPPHQSIPPSFNQWEKRKECHLDPWAHKMKSDNPEDATWRSSWKDLLEDPGGAHPPDGGRPTWPSPLLHFSLFSMTSETHGSKWKVLDG